MGRAFRVDKHRGFDYGSIYAAFIQHVGKERVKK